MPGCVSCLGEARRPNYICCILARRWKEEDWDQEKLSLYSVWNIINEKSIKDVRTCYGFVISHKHVLCTDGCARA